MGNMWDYIRRWLIRKLGGYDELPDQVMEQKHIKVQQNEIEIVPISVSVLIDEKQVQNETPDFVEQSVRKFMADKIAKELATSSVLRIISCPDSKKCAVRFIGFVSVVL